MKKNLIFISLDTVRADVAYSGKFKAINSLRQKGVTFLNTISSSPLTPISHATVFSGLQPYNHGIRHLFKEKLKPGVNTIAQILKKRKYKTGAIVSCPGMNKWYGFSKGFDYYDDEIPKLADGSDPLKTIDVKKRGTALKRADEVVRRASIWLDKHKQQQFFLFLHFFDAHWPYKAPEKFHGNNAYEQEVAFTDHYLDIFLKKLKYENLLQNTTIVCFSDHGEDLNGLYSNDKGGNQLGHPEEFGHGCLLYDQTQKVVFIIRDPDNNKKLNIHRQVRTVDILPTVLSMIRIPTDKIKTDGESLFPFEGNRNAKKSIAYSETLYPEEQTFASGKYPHARNKKSIRINNKYKIIFHLNSEKIEVYNLKNDPNELHNLI